MSIPASELTDSRVKRAGRTLRRFFRDEDGVSIEQALEARRVALAFRGLHQRPLGKANMGLRSMVKTAGCEVEVSQRMKRWPTMLSKLVREPQLPLHKMQDIGGCRAILHDLDEIERGEARIREKRPEAMVVDYIANPRLSVYRGKHVIVRYDGRQIEIQLRTWVMHEWAITVERISSRIGTNLKGDGGHAVQQLMAAISEAMAIEESGGVVPERLESLIRERRLVADPFLKGSA